MACVSLVLQTSNACGNWRHGGYNSALCMAKQSGLTGHEWRAVREHNTLTSAYASHVLDTKKASDGEPGRVSCSSKPSAMARAASLAWPCSSALVTLSSMPIRHTEHMSVGPSSGPPPQRCCSSCHASTLMRFMSASGARRRSCIHGFAALSAESSTVTKVQQQI